MSKPSLSKSARSSARANALPLKRGAACLNCRHFKIKCDGKRPHCTPCLTHPKEDECEYQDGPRSRTKALEDKIAALEAHIYDLENPNETPPMQLSDPYSPTQTEFPQAGSSSGVVRSSSSESPLSGSGMYSPSHDSSASGPSRRSPRDFLSHLDIPPSSAVEEEPSSSVIQNLIELFMPQASQIGFFLNSEKFMNSILLTAPIGSHTRPCPSLLYATYLWGSHFRNFHDVAQQRSFESRALRYCSTDLSSSSHPDRLLHTIQANVLLAYYYLHANRLQEASYFATGASSMILSSGLHLSAPTLPTPNDDIEATERLDAFWSVFVLSRIVAISARPSMPSVSGLLEGLGSDADVPWPLNSGDEQNIHLPDPSNRTAVSFIQGLTSPSMGGNNILVLEAKASMLLNEVSSLMSRWGTEGLSPMDTAAMTTSYKRLADLITSLRPSLPPLDALEATQDYASRLYVVLAMFAAAAIILFQTFADSEQSYRFACIKSAVDIILPGNLDVKSLTYVDPIMGFVWSTAISALMQESTRLQYNPPVNAQYTEQQLSEWVARGISYLQTHATNSPMIREFLLVERTRNKHPQITLSSLQRINTASPTSSSGHGSGGGRRSSFPTTAAAGPTTPTALRIDSQNHRRSLSSGPPSASTTTTMYSASSPRHYQGGQYIQRGDSPFSTTTTTSSMEDGSGGGSGGGGSEPMRSPTQRYSYPMQYPHIPWTALHI